MTLRRHVLAFLLAYSLILGACSSGPALIDSRKFNANRQPLSDATVDGLIIPGQVGKYDLRPSRGVLPPTTAARQYIGLYESLSGQEILLTAILMPDTTARQSALTAKNSCDSAAEFVTPYPTYAYTYSACKGEHRFTWINGNWVLSAATYLKTDAADLLEFVISYSY